MNIDVLLERTPRAASHYEQLFDVLKALNLRTGQPVHATLTLDKDAFAALRADKTRPGKPLASEWIGTVPGVVVTFKEEK